MFPREIETIEDLLAAWDSGDTIWSLELGGLGPGYEQAIQIAAIEIARKLKEYKPTENAEQDECSVKKIRDEVIHQIDKECGGFSGAQVGAASWLAWQWCHNGGPRKLQERAKEQGKQDQCILVNKAFPMAPAATGK